MNYRFNKIDVLEFFLGEIEFAITHKNYDRAIANIKEVKDYTDARKSNILNVRELLNESEELAEKTDEESVFSNTYYEGKAQGFREVLALLGDFE